MIKYFYSVYDASAESYSDPVVLVSDNVSARTFALEAQNPDSLIKKFPADFTLFCVGSFDTSSGETASMNKVICRGTDFMEKE